MAKSSPYISSKGFFVIPCFEKVKTNGGRFLFKERILYVRENVFELLLRRVLADKKNYREISNNLRNMIPVFEVGR